MNLFEYQEEALKKILESDCKRQLITMPTGTGKTILFLKVIQALNRKTLVLMHRNELIRQTVSKALKIGFDISQIGEFSFERKALNYPLVVGSVQTCIRHIPEIEKAEFQCLVIDECHHSAADSYQEIISRLGFTDNNRYLLGFTATPIRGDNLSLSETFLQNTYNLTLKDAILKEYISDIRGIFINMLVDLKSIKTSQGDYTIKDLSKEMNTPEKNEIIAKTVKERALDKKSIAFCVTIQHATDLCEELSKIDGIKTCLITGSMSMKEREEIYSAFQSGSANVLCSCMVLTEGFDVPAVNCILMARPTRSPSLYRQMIGRGLRKHPGKKECLVIEFTSNDRKMLTLEDISPEKKQRRVRDGESFKEASENEEKEEKERVEVQSRTYDVEVEVYDPLDRENKPVFISETIGNGYFYTPHHFGFFYGEPKGGKFYVKEFVKTEMSFAPTNFSASYDGYALALECIQNIMHKRKVKKFYPLPGDPITPKQFDILNKFKLPCEFLSKREASKLIERLFIVRFLNKYERKNFSIINE